MEGSGPQNTQQTISQWIVSLAISVTCCAVLFVVFAGYLSDIKKNIAVENAQLEQMTAHEEQLLLEIKAVQHTIANNQAPAPTMAPITSVKPTPAEAAPSSPVVPSTTPSATTPVTPPPASPTAIPEVAPKK